MFSNAPIVIRQVEESEAQAFLDLCRRLDEETSFRMLEPGERRTTPEQQQRIIHNFLIRDNFLLLSAEKDGQLIGYLSAEGGLFHRNRHSVYIVIAILQAYTGQGIGARLFVELERWALERQVHRLELTVMTNNPRAIAFYQKMGFKIEGLKDDAVNVDGVYIDEYMMARILE
jgi:RimJ/RimL family protein N-acetyltransferase